MVVPVRPEVQRFVDAGCLPAEDAPIEEIEKRAAQLLAIDLPASDEEARLLLGCFGPDHLYGMNQSLLSLIESAPRSPLESRPALDANRWVQEMWARIENARLRERQKPQ